MNERWTHNQLATLLQQPEVLPLPVMNFGSEGPIQLTNPMPFGLIDHEFDSRPAPNYAGAATVNTLPEPLPLPVYNFGPDDGPQAADVARGRTGGQFAGNCYAHATHGRDGAHMVLPLPPPTT